MISFVTGAGASRKPRGLTHYNVIAGRHEQFGRSEVAVDACREAVQSYDIVIQVRSALRLLAEGRSRGRKRSQPVRGSHTVRVADERLRGFPKERQNGVSELFVRGGKPKFGWAGPRVPSPSNHSIPSPDRAQPIEFSAFRRTPPLLIATLW